jgi:hypothetical protein
LAALGPAILVHRGVFAQGLTIEFFAMVSLLLLNVGFFLGFSLMRFPAFEKMGISFAFLLVTLKLFVNLSALLLLLGLKLVSIPVFVSSFFAGYLMLLCGGVAFLIWNGNQN